MPGHEIKNGFTENSEAPENQAGVRLSTHAAETLSGIFNSNPNEFESIDNMDKFRQLIYEPVNGNPVSIYEALDESITGLMQTYVINLAHGKEIKVERDRNGFQLARTYAPRVTCWTDANSYVIVPHASYSGYFSAENGNHYNVGGAMRSFDPEQASGYYRELLKELREIEIGLSLQEYQDQDIEETRMEVASELLTIIRSPGFSTVNAAAPLADSLYDRGGMFLGAKQLDWLLDNNPGGVKIRHDVGFTRISYHQTDKYYGHYQFELGEDYEFNGQSHEALRTWFMLGRNYVMGPSFMPTVGPQAGKYREPIFSDDQEETPAFKYEVTAALNQVVAGLGVR